MTGREAQGWIGRRGALQVDGDLQVTVRVEDVSSALGRVDVLVVGGRGDGSAWVPADRVVWFEPALDPGPGTFGHATSGWAQTVRLEIVRPVEGRDPVTYVEDLSVTSPVGEVFTVHPLVEAFTSTEGVRYRRV